MNLNYVYAGVGVLVVGTVLASLLPVMGPVIMELERLCEEDPTACEGVAPDMTPLLRLVAVLGVVFAIIGFVLGVVRHYRDRHVRAFGEFWDRMDRETLAS